MNIRTSIRFFRLMIYFCNAVLLTSLLCCLADFSPLLAQDQEELPPAGKAFTVIEKAMQSGDINKLSALFSDQTYISLASGYSGYCSKNQAYYVLQGYFSVHQPVGFRISAVGSGRAPYATGVYSFEARNKRGTAQVFISLKWANAGWLISQLTIR